VDHAPAGGDQGLLLVLRGHLALPPGEDAADVLEGLRIDQQLTPGGLGDCLSREIVGRGSQPAGR